MVDTFHMKLKLTISIEKGNGDLKTSPKRSLIVFPALKFVNLLQLTILEFYFSPLPPRPSFIASYEKRERKQYLSHLSVLCVSQRLSFLGNLQ